MNTISDVLNWVFRKCGTKLGIIFLVTLFTVGVFLSVVYFTVATLRLLARF